MNDTILDLLSKHGLKAEKISEVEGGQVEYVGPCPKCGGTDRFRVVMNPREQGSGGWWCRACALQGRNIQAFLQAFGEPQPGTVVVDDVWSFFKKSPLVDENTSQEKLREVVALLIEYLEVFSDKNDRLTKMVDWLAGALAEDGCPYLAYWADFGGDMRPDWCICTDTPDDGFYCTGDPKACWEKEAARRAVADAKGEVEA